MASDMTLEKLDGRTVVDRDRTNIGSVEDIYFDPETREPEWALVKTGMFGNKSTFVPLTNATFEGDILQIPFTKAQVKDAPNMNDDGELSQEEEAQLASHYGMTYSEAPSHTGLPVDGGPAAAQIDEVGGPRQDTSGATDSAMTRSEEELRVSKTRRPSGLVRLRKHIVQEQVSTTVPVEREEARVKREAITDANVGAAMDGPALSEEEHELVLTEEQVVVDKEVVPKERIRLEKVTIVEEQQVNETVAREEIEVEGDATGRGTV